MRVFHSGLLRLTLVVSQSLNERAHQWRTAAMRKYWKNTVKKHQGTCDNIKKKLFSAHFQVQNKHRSPEMWSTCGCSSLLVSFVLVEQ